MITGASSGMGKDTAAVLAKNGYKVHAAARRAEEMEEIKQARGIPVVADVTKDTEIQQLVELFIGRGGRIDVLWNNAGHGLYGVELKEHNVNW